MAIMDRGPHYGERAQTIRKLSGRPGVSDRLKLYQIWVPQVSILRPGKARIHCCEVTRSNN
jgi:ribosomal protein L19